MSRLTTTIGINITQWYEMHIFYCWDEICDAKTIANWIISISKVGLFVTHSNFKIASRENKQAWQTENSRARLIWSSDAEWLLKGLVILLNKTTPDPLFAFFLRFWSDDSAKNTRTLSLNLGGRKKILLFLVSQRNRFEAWSTENGGFRRIRWRGILSSCWGCGNLVEWAFWLTRCRLEIIFVDDFLNFLSITG